MPSPRAIDLNCDLGELDRLWQDGTEARLLRLVTSANVACGGHAGDRTSMERTAARARALGVALGAHPSYPDRSGFGRAPMAMAHDALAAEVGAQLNRIAGIVSRLGGRLAHLKPHGALYHAAAHDLAVAETIADVAARWARASGGDLPVLVGLAGSPGLARWRALGHVVAAEGFADRRHESDGTLRPRSREGALLVEPAAAAAQAVRLARGEVGVEVDTLCVHSDTPGAVDITRAVRAALEAEGFAVRALRRR